jgi:integrase
LPLYKKDFKRLIEFPEVDQMIQKTKNPEHKVLLALLYLTGARPAELLELKKRNFLIVGSDLRMILPTKKRKKAGAVNDRLLPVDIEETPFVKSLIMPWVESLPSQDSDVLSIRTTTRIQQIVYALSDNQLCPYTFRHNRLSQLAMGGATVDELRQWKGASNIASITPYLLMSPRVLDRIKKGIK